MADNSPIAKEISAVNNWLAAIDVIRTNLKLPDLTTSSGLRQVARSPHKVFPRLEKAYTDHLKDPLVLGALALIWGRIWTERRARQALYDTGFLINIIRLITTTPDCRVPALQSLVTIVHHASQPVLTDIAHRTTRTLLLLLRTDTESPIIQELITIILTHATAPGPSLDVLKSDGIDYTSLIQTLSRAVRRPTATRTMQTHFLGFLRAIASRLHFNLSADSSSIHFLVAHFPSTNFAIRGDAILALNDLHSSGAEHERSTWDPNAYYRAAVAAQTELSDDILERMEVHMGGNLLTSDIYVNTRATDDFQDAMATVLEDKDMYALAKKLYPLVLATESSIPQGAFRDKHGELIPIEELGLPFSSFIDALPHAADAIRMRGIHAERLAADVLEVKHALLTRQHLVVQQICEERIETDSHVGFFYYALVLSASSSGGDGEGRRMPTTERLKLAKRGLMCEGTTAYIRLGLHKVAAECAYKLGMGRLKVAAGPAMGPIRPSDGPDNDDSDEEEELSPRRMLQYYTEAIVFFTSALDDTRDYTKAAPLDYRLHKNVLLMQTILSLVLEGEGKRDLEPVLAQQEIVDQLYTTLYNAIPKSQSRLAVNAIIPNWENAQREWDALLRKFDRRAPAETQELTHLHAIEGELQGELEAETDFKDRPPTYISTLDIPALTHPRSTTPAGIPLLDSDKARDEADLRQAYATLAAWMQGSSNKSLSSSMSGLTIPAFSPTSPSPITPGPETPHTSLPPPTVSPCILDRRPYVDVHAIPVVQYRCYACGNPSDGSDLKTCSGCRRTKYCDEVCQKKHWINGHGDECLPDNL